MYKGQSTKPLEANRNVQCTMDNVQIREYGGEAAGIGDNGAANGNVQISELGTCGAALFLFSPSLGVGESEEGAVYLGCALAVCLGSPLDVGEAEAGWAF